MRSLWRSSYHRQVTRYIEKHFGRAHGITELFPYMGAEFEWLDKPEPGDPRTAIKSHHEYHGLERHARQYHVTAQYREAAEHWLIAAAWRREMIWAQGLDDDRRHMRAAEFAIKNYQYNMALSRWQRRKRRFVPFPAPEDFGLRSDMMKEKDVVAAGEIAAVTGIESAELLDE